MRSICFSVLTLAVLAISTPASAASDPYKWCAEYADDDGSGGRNCGFTTYEQCMATVRGIGGFCEVNQLYTEPEQRKPSKRKPVRR